MRNVRVALVIAARILRQRLRDRSAIVFSVLTPLGLAVAFSLLIPNDFASFHTRFVVVDQDGGMLATALVDDVLGGLATAGVADTDRVADEASAAAEVRSEKASAAIIIPAGFTTAIQSGKPTRLRILGGAFPASLAVARAAVGRFASDIGATQLLIATTAATGQAVDSTTIERATQAVHEASPITVAESAPQRLQASLATFYGAAMAIMFVFFATQYGALALLADRQGGTLNRLLASPASPAAIVLGSSLAGFALGLVSMTVLVVATTLLVGATWGPAWLVAILVIAAVTAAMGISAAVASISRTPQQAGGLNAIVALSMAAIGGVFIPLSQAPPALATISVITPHAWFIRGINTLSGANPGLGDVGQPILVLLAFGLVTGAIGLARARRSLMA
jgi:linearmycin/streptolysin S transport system permease protein